MNDIKKAQKWKAIAIRLAKSLDRFCIECGVLDHRPSEYHNSGPCPVCEKIDKAIEDFNRMQLEDE